MSPPAPAPAALSRAQISARLDGVPTFVVVDGDGEVVRPRDEQGEAVPASFHTDPEEAKAALDKLRNDPLAAGGAEGLRLAVTPLGAAFEACGGWPGAKAGGAKAADEGGTGGAVLQGTKQVVEGMAPRLREQLQAQGLEAGAWQLPVFCCDEMQTEAFTPIFLRHEDMVEAWVASGRPREQAPQQVAVMDLRLLVAQMQTDAFAWSTVKVLCSREAVELAAAVQEERARAKAPSK
eukprot:Transcript_30136.p1 GENE.Transcript_30136~~Transcript_30136.p1  ORF type:complete len:262 (-),score=85.87 Transcript_30136:89-796(-)